MRSFAFLPVVFAAAVSGCVTETHDIEVEIQATSPKNAGELHRATPLCFGEQLRNREISKVRHDEAVRICSAVARSKGLTVVKHTEAAKCILTEVVPRDDDLVLTFFALGKSEPTDVIHTVRAELADKSTAMPSRATVALCRAAFQAYPADIGGKSYIAGTDMPGGAPVPSSEHCIAADTWFWQIPREVCTTPDNRVCTREYDRQTLPGDCHARK